MATQTLSIDRSIRMTKESATGHTWWRPDIVPPGRAGRVTRTSSRRGHAPGRRTRSAASRSTFEVSEMVDVPKFVVSAFLPLGIFDAWARLR
jgi:hypothetical protein